VSVPHVDTAGAAKVYRTAADPQIQRASGRTVPVVHRPPPHPKPIDSCARSRCLSGIWRRLRGRDPVDKVFGPGDPYLGADPGLERQAGLGSFGGFVGAAEAPGEHVVAGLDSYALLTMVALMGAEMSISLEWMY
jgi:hypothetical protein